MKPTTTTPHPESREAAHGFEVRLSYPFDEWKYGETDKVFKSAAGRRRDFSGSDGCRRDLGWCCETFDEAASIRDFIEGVRPGFGFDFNCHIRER